MRRAGTPALLMLCGRVAASAAEVHLVVPILLGHVRVFEPQLDGWTAARELLPTMCLRHAADGRPRRHWYNQCSHFPGMKLVWEGFLILLRLVWSSGL